jgi:6-phosphogluconolactonase
MNFRKDISPDPAAAAEACGRAILDILSNALAERPAATLAISGGSTPKLLFSWLAEQPFDWSRVHLFWVDERAVPPGDPQSNFTLADTSWLTPGAFPKENIHRIHAEKPVGEAASIYADDIRGYFDLDEGQIPVFDIIQQGIGADVHTASLFPGEPAVLDTAGVAAAVYVDKLKAARITLLPAVLAAARHTLMLVCGEDKQPALETVFHGPENIQDFPAQLTRHHHGEVVWFLDEAAARSLA